MGNRVPERKIGELNAFFLTTSKAIVCTDDYVVGGRKIFRVVFCFLLSHFWFIIAFPFIYLCILIIFQKLSHKGIFSYAVEKAILIIARIKYIARCIGFAVLLKLA